MFTTPVPLLSLLVCLAVTAVNAARADDRESSLITSSAAFPVRVEFFENVTNAADLNLDHAEPIDHYFESAFGFSQFPAKYSENALPLDRSNPFIIRAQITRALPPGKYEFRLRSKGTARFLVGTNVLLTTKPQKGNTSGHDEVPPPAEIPVSGIRPLPYPHQETNVVVELSGEPTEFTLLALIGGKGLIASPGELSVSFARSGDLPRLLGAEITPVLTDAGWSGFAAGQKERLRSMDALRRTLLSSRVRHKWDEYHQEVKLWIAQRPALTLPKVSLKTPVFNLIDRFIGSRLEQAAVRPTSLLGDLEFLRKVSLDLIGMIPSPEEIKIFQTDPPATRKQKSIDRLLKHPGWADHWVSYWQDVLAENPGILKPDLNNSGPFRWWLHQSFSDNIPFDRLVAELIQMEGSIYLGAPAAFKLATLNDAPMAAKADILSQAFLAEKLSCARCHDAPQHTHKQKDLFSLASMLEGKAMKLPASSTVPLIEGFRKPRVEVTLKPGEEVAAHWPFDKMVLQNDSAPKIPVFGKAPSSRNEVAANMVSPANDRFARVMVNRVWKRFLGAALVEPVEDWSTAKASHPELLDYLARFFVDNGYDLKALSRLILSSHLYQRRSVPRSEIPAVDQRLFEGPLRRRMSAEQLVDSLFRASGKEFGSEEMNLNPAGNRSIQEFNNLGTPERAWQFTALMNERDRPALALPVSQSIVDVLTTYGWRQSRQNPLTVREDSPSPMQTLLLANGVMGTRITRLSDDSVFTELSLKCATLNDLIEQTFLRLLSRQPSNNELRVAKENLDRHFAHRKVEGNPKAKSSLAADRRVSWANHLSAEATSIRMEEERRLRMGDEPTARLTADFREPYEDLIWSLVNASEFILIP